MNKILLPLFLLMLSACISGNNDNRNAVAVIRDLNSGKIIGDVFFQTQKDGNVKVTTDLKNIKGTQAIHIHEYGDLRDNNGSFAGGHFNPFERNHGKPSDIERHVGDLGNITANSNGIVKSEFIDEYITLYGKNSVLGRAVIIHQHQDDFKGESGNAGARVAAGVISLTK